jgi:hypothetical protein
MLVTLMCIRWACSSNSYAKKHIQSRVQSAWMCNAIGRWNVNLSRFSYLGREREGGVALGIFKKIQGKHLCKTKCDGESWSVPVGIRFFLQYSF